MAVTRDEFAEWMEHPVTKRLKEQIRKDISNMQDMLLTVDEIDLKSLQGRCAASINLLNMEFEDLYE